MGDTGNKRSVGILNCCTVNETRMKPSFHFSDKTTIWRTYYIKTAENTEQRIIIQMYSI
jgi:hypothetical protein